MKALKITVVALLVVIAGLLVTIRRLTHETAPESAASTAATQAPASQPAAPAAEPAPVPVQPEKPSPVTPKRRVTRERSVTAPSEPAPPAEPAPAPAAAKSEPPAAAAPAAPVAEGPRTPPAPPAPRRVTIPAGAAIVVRTQNTLSTDRNLKGDTFRTTLEEPITADGMVIAERGADVEGVVTRSQRAGRVEGTSELDVELVRLHTSDGQRISIATNLHDVQGQRSRGSDAKKIGAATGIGAIIGAIAGGGKGAAIGAGVGAGAGGGAVLATRGKPSVIPSESILTFHLRTPVEVTERR